MAKLKQDWEKEFIVALVRLRDFFMNQEGSELVGPRNAKVIESIIIGYFCERRPRIHIQEVSFYINFEDMAIFINDVVLDYMNDEHPGFLNVDWQLKYIIKSESEDLFANEDDKEDY